MTPQQMQENSAKKVQQVLDLMKSLYLKVEPRQRISQEGFLENMVFWIDDEKYPAAEPASPAGQGDAPAAPEPAQEGSASTGEEVAA